MPTTTAVIGGGAIAKSHIDGYQKAGAEVKAVCDVSKEALEKMKAAYKIPVLTENVKDILNDKSIDAVSVCTPNAFHMEYTIQALEAGKHVICEKPMAMNAEQAQKMVDAAKKAKKILMLGHNHRFRPEVQKVKEMINEGKFGEIYHAKSAWIRRRGIPGMGGWFTTKSKSGGGPLIDIGIHIMDVTWYLMGMPKPVSISGMTYRKFGDIAKYVCSSMWAGPRKLDGVMDVEDFATALIRFEGGKTMSIEVSWAANRNQDDHVYIMGDKAGALLKMDGATTIFGEHDNMIVTEQVEFDKAPYKDRIAHFVDCVQGKAECICTGEHGLLDQKMLDAWYKSSEQGKEVAIN
ncbi:MAG: Gfo/Idh/MocA family oxidoreductase [Spirochaetes bacterium]|nr:Gfo/Idh/MocA family oxidoreductase [Spirochaetota bacterium]